MFGQSFFKYVILVLLILSIQEDLLAQRQMEKLGRGMIAVRQAGDTLHI